MLTGPREEKEEEEKKKKKKMRRRRRRRRRIRKRSDGFSEQSIQICRRIIGGKKWFGKTGHILELNVRMKLQSWKCGLNSSL
jgi:hypothetical protein